MSELIVQNLRKKYKARTVVHDISLNVQSGEVVGLLGPNGAGKTTLLRMLAGIDKPDTGKIIEGHGLKVGYFAQEHETLDVSKSEIGRAHV